jgi:hydroxymethylbilane synthase
LQTTLRIGTRGSKLALAQANEVRRGIEQAWGPQAPPIEIVTITTTGDRIRDRPLADIGGKALFTKEIEEALIAGVIDLAVHSMKDVPAIIPPGLVIAAVLPREDPRDALVSPAARSLAELSPGMVVGSSSVRRRAQVLRFRGDVDVVPLRGNVDTRLAKLDRGEIAAIILACAGLRRLGLEARITAAIPPEEMLPAVAQGAIGVEIRAGDERTADFVRLIDHDPTGVAVACERAFLASLEGSCRTPIAGHAVVDSGTVRFRGEALATDGSFSFTVEVHGSVADAVRLGREAGEEVKAKAGDRLMLGG